MAATASKKAASNWVPWVLGVALVISISVAALHFSEAEEIARITERARPWWLLLAIVLQLATYYAQGEIYRTCAAAAGFPLARGSAYRLSLAKLFIDQALPSAGLSGTAAVSRHLEQIGMARRAVMATAVVNLSSYFVTYVVLLLVALLLLPVSGPVQTSVVLAVSLFAAASLAVVIILLALPGRAGSITQLLVRVRPLRGTIEALETADSKLARRPQLLLTASVWQSAIMLLDAATIWVLVEALGTRASAAGVFSGFMLSNLFRTIGILPGGLGTFETSSVLTLQLVGVPLPVSLSATLLFRGLSFWLPMLPGMWISRQLFVIGKQFEKPLPTYWARSIDEVLLHLSSSERGLTSQQAAAALDRYGRNELRRDKPVSRFDVLVRQLMNPLLMLLLLAALVAAATGQMTDAVIVLAILAASAIISSRREYSAHTAAAALRERIRARAKVLRDGLQRLLPVEDLVPGDVVALSAGSLVPADGLVLEATDCFVSEAVLTGESFPVAKSVGSIALDSPLTKRSNCVYLGTNVRSGTARFVVVATGAQTQFGGIAQRLALRPEQTEFDRGVLRFGYLLTVAMLVITLVVFVAHMLDGRPIVDTLLFAVALAVGLSPELLPAILSVNLARGAQMLARQGVLVRHLNAIENLGSMDVLCTDKTGTLTEGVVSLEGGYDSKGERSSSVIDLGAINAALETGLASPLDDAILAHRKPDPAGLRKLAEIPFDFVRKRVSIVVERNDEALLLTKGAVGPVLETCTTLADGTALDAQARCDLEHYHTRWSSGGIRVLAVATRTLPLAKAYNREDERELTFQGFLTFLDRPKEGAAQAIANLRRLGVSVKLITGDTRLVAQHVAQLVGLKHERMLTGAQLDEFHDEALWREAERTDLFVEVDPNQKERIILSLKKMGRVVGFLGDGVNDAPAMHASDTSLSVEHAVDVAREAADFVLLQRDLDVIRRGIEEGRRTFANTLKYVLTTTSANLGNMMSMAVASLFLPFLPLTAGQILLNNFLSDIPAVGMADDNVDHELLERPRRWDMRFIGRYMVEFGLLSSVFDLLTFACLLWVFKASPEVFRTAWFVESLLTELVIALVIRTQRPLFQSRPGTLLFTSSLALIVLTPIIPYLPFIAALGFVPLPATLIATLAMIAVVYIVAAEATKQWFYRTYPQR